MSLVVRDAVLLFGNRLLPDALQGEIPVSEQAERKRCGAVCR